MAKNFLVALTRNTISLVGTALAVASATLIITLTVIQQMGFQGSAYLGLITFVALPMLLLTGLILIPVGISRERRRMAAAAAEGEESVALFPVLDLNNERVRKNLIMFLIFTTFSVVVLGSATYKGVHVMDSVAFCGTVCHTVMQPEYTAHQRSPHARVPCADCHIGPGADWFVKSKISGSWQLIAVALNIYPTPIPTPIHNLRPARETCEQCHWPTNFVGDLLKVHTNFAEDETNSQSQTSVLLRVGGLAGRKSSGIHWHVNPDVRIRYKSDESRENIYDIELTRQDGTVTLFKGDPAPEGEESPDWKVMDCVDCHNRPSHRYRLPSDEVDMAMVSMDIDHSLPFVKRESMRLLQAGYESHDQARADIPTGLKAFYTTEYPELAGTQADAIARAGDELVEIYTSNVFPAMKVDWGTYPDHSGHQESPGCFRCHDRKHKSEEGAKIPRKCDTCHTLLADEEVDSEILKILNP
jgi:hypothetical protein